MANCIEQGMVTCWDGSCKSSYADCPEATEGSDGAYTAWDYTNPWTDEGEHELRDYIYDYMGGQDYFGMDVEGFWENYGSSFMEYDPTQAENIASQGGILDWQYELGLEGFDITREGHELSDDELVNALSDKRGLATNDLFNATLSLEGVRRRTGGIGQGQSQKIIAKAYGDIEDKFEADEKGIDIGRKGIVLDMSALDNAVATAEGTFAGNELSLLQDINKLEGNFEDKLIQQMTDYIIGESMEGQTSEECAGTGDLAYDGVCMTQTEYNELHADDVNDDCGGEGQPECNPAMQYDCEHNQGMYLYNTGGTWIDGACVQTGGCSGAPPDDSGCYHCGTSGNWEYNFALVGCTGTEPDCGGEGQPACTEDDFLDWECENAPNGPCCSSSPNYDPCSSSCPGADCPEDDDSCTGGGGTWTFVPPASGYGLGNGSYCCCGGSEHDDSCDCGNYVNPFN